MSIVFLVGIVNANDMQTITICGGDQETLIHCSGDNELSYIAKVEGSQQDIGEITTFGIQDGNTLLIILISLIALSGIIVLITYDIHKKRNPKKRQI